MYMFSLCKGMRAVVLDAPSPHSFVVGLLIKLTTAAPPPAHSHSPFRRMAGWPFRSIVIVQVPTDGI
jgi:hypothetical protein